MSVSLRQKIGCWLNERWRLELACRVPAISEAIGLRWNGLCNRHEALEYDMTTNGYQCRWRDTSVLTAVRMFPHLGAQLLRCALNEWPVEFASRSQQTSSSPEVSVLVGVRGTNRLPQFQATLQSLLAQQDCAVEIIVVEQSQKPEFQSLLPPEVNYVHTNVTSPEMPFNRSWAFNVAARQARGEVMVLHDADMVVPARFAGSIRDIVAKGVEAVRLPRYLFYLDKESSEVVWTEKSFRAVRIVERVVQNNETPMAVTRDAYFRLGGHDESFYGWGGEDNEFMDRCDTLKFARGAYLPLFHLWHPEAPNRSGDRNWPLLSKRRSIPLSQRIEELTARTWGGMEPSIPWKPAGTALS